MNKRLELNYVLRANSSVFHNGGEVFTTTALFRREKFVLPDGGIIDLPIVSGNAIRGILRDVAAEVLLRKTGINSVDIAAFDLLFSGGSLSEGPEKLDIDRIRHIRRTLPPVSVFGGSIQNIILPGKLKVGKMLLLCQETAHLVDDRLHKYCAKSAYDLMQVEMYVRKDDAKNELFAQYLSDVVQEDIRKGFNVGELRSSSAAQQMMYRVESIAAGSLFYLSLIVDDDKDDELDKVDKGCFLSAWDWFLRYKQAIGGRSSAGHGQIVVHDVLDASLDESQQQHLIELYFDFLEKNKEKILLALSSVK